MRRLIKVVAEGDHYYFPEKPTTSVTGPAWIYDDGSIVQGRHKSGRVVYAVANWKDLNVTHHDNWPDGFPEPMTKLSARREGLVPMVEGGE